MRSAKVLIKLGLYEFMPESGMQFFVEIFKNLQCLFSYRFAGDNDRNEMDGIIFLHNFRVGNLRLEIIVITSLIG